MKFKGYYFFTIIALVLQSCSQNENTSLFQLRAPHETGIDFENKVVSTPDLNILNYIYFYNGGGVAAADFNNDGLVDLYFTSNQDSDKLYINKGNLQFHDITRSAKITNNSGWTNGVSIVDINNDGWLDIYICKVGDFGSIKGNNLLYMNQGTDSNGAISFKESAKSYHLDFVGFSTQGTFFDYDLDGDLDLFLLNHSTNPNLNYSNGSSRQEINHESGDKLFENINGDFIDVTEYSGIFQGKIGYGLGVSISDLNNDGYPDIYVSNDFYENDYLYLNQGNKTFKEIIHNDDSFVGHTTHYSMGNDISDLNNDGYADIVSVDMLPEDLQTYKTSGTEFNYQIYNNYIKNGYAHQYMQNALQMNNGNGSFSETAYLSGVAASEWSWCPLIADFDNDSFNDLFITNGILGATNDMDFINFIANDNIQKSLGQGMTEKEMKFIDQIPSKKTPNYLFQNRQNNTFKNVTSSWFTELPSFSNGATYADLDNDGDLDIVVNNVNDPAFIMENRTNLILPKNHFLKIRFEGMNENHFGIGAKAILYHGNKKWMRENFTSRGYLSSVTPEVNFGLDSISKIDSIHIIWPGGHYETLKNVSPNQTITVKAENAKGIYSDPSRLLKTPLFTTVVSTCDFIHQENPTIEFNRDPLLPFSLANEGPDISVADVNNDGMDDLFLSGAKGQPSELYLQEANGNLKLTQPELFQIDAINEDVSQLFFDANNDGYADLLVVSGGNEFVTGSALSPRLYINRKGVFEKDSLQFKDVFVNASQVSSVDLNNDGALDICILSNAVPHNFGYSSRQYLFLNDGSGNFKDITLTYAPELANIGNCNAIAWVDLNGDGYKDALTAGDWSPISIWMNDGSQLVLQHKNGLEETHGWWNTLKTGDFDHDGDIDFVAGNWGLNSRLRASLKEPISLYKTDFDGNNSEETLITYFYQGKETTLSSKEELAKQLPMINKKFLSYGDFAKASISDIFGQEKLKNSRQKKVYMLASGYFENTGNNHYKFHPLPFEAQLSSVNDFWIEDFNGDSFPDLLLVGNNYEVSTQLGRLDALHGMVFLNNGQANFAPQNASGIAISGACRHVQKIILSDQEYYIITRNNDKPIFIKRNKQ
jgi:enediyne biosynthesis protein E4